METGYGRRHKCIVPTSLLSSPAAGICFRSTMLVVESIIRWVTPRSPFIRPVPLMSDRFDGNSRIHNLVH